MTANYLIRENAMVDAAIEWLRARLPSGWEVGPTNRQLPPPRQGSVDAAIDLKGPNGTYTTIAVEVKQRFGPRDVDLLLGGLSRTLLSLTGGVRIMVVAPWLSAQTRDRLREQDVDYLDLTGNSLLRVENPALFIATQGATKDPSPSPRGKARFQGPKAGRLARMLVDFRPPYGVRDLAAASALTPGYVSRLLDTLDDEAVIERSARGGVETVDIKGVIRRWAVSYDVFKANDFATYLAPAGASDAMARLGILGSRVAVTGSFAAVRLAPVAGPALLAAYCEDRSGVATELGLIPTDEGANVALLRPFDAVVWDRTTTDDGVTYVAPSQAAADCLTGNGRMPAEGDALLEWMTADEEPWRLNGLPAPMLSSDS